MSKHKAKRSDHGAALALNKRPDPLADLNPGRKMLYALMAGTAVIIALAVFVPSNRSSDTQMISANRPIDPGLIGARVLVADSASHDFGRISMARGKVSHRYAIRNTGTTPVTITRISTSCMCTEATLVTGAGERGPFGMAGHGLLRSVSERLAPGEAAQVDVVFDPAAHGPAGVGPTSRVVTIAYDAGPPLELQFNALVTP